MYDSEAKSRARSLMRDIRARHPRLRDAVAADARVTLFHRSERHELSPGADTLLAVLRLLWIDDGFLAQTLYRLKARLQALRVPLLPRLAHHMAVLSGQVSIGDPVIVHPGCVLLHGHVVIDGFAEIHPGVVIGPFVTIGLRSGDVIGPTIEREVKIGTGAKVLGNVRVGAGATIGANAVVVDDVEPGATVVGVPARQRP